MKSFADIERENGGKYPGFAFLRHALSVTILVHHCRIAIRGDRIEPVADVTLQNSDFILVLTSGEAFRPFLFALVASFFALSGFLVAGSAVRTGNMRVFLTFRGLRILPALMSEVTLSAIVLGAFLTTLPVTEYYSSPGFWRYFGNIAGFVTFYLPGVFETNPVPGIVNINLWTLTPEFYCYIIITALIGFGAFRQKSLLLGLFAALTLICVFTTLPGFSLLDTRDSNTHFSSWFIVYLFLTGVVFYCFSDRIPFSFGLMALSGAIYFVGMILRLPDVMSCLALVYFTLSAGALKFPGFGFLERYDYSYGIYLYGYPIGQTLIYVLDRNGLLVKTAPVYLGVIIATLILTLLFSAISWRYIEQPFLALKRYVAKPKKPVAGTVRLRSGMTQPAE